MEVGIVERGQDSRDLEDVYIDLMDESWDQMTLVRKSGLLTLSYADYSWDQMRKTD